MASWRHPLAILWLEASWKFASLASWTHALADLGTRARRLQPALDPENLEGGWQLDTTKFVMNFQPNSVGDESPWSDLQLFGSLRKK